jgi:endonuclease III
MNGTQTTPLIVVGTHVTREFAQRFREVAASEHRTVSQELRRLMEQRIAEADAAEDVAA